MKKIFKLHHFEFFFFVKRPINVMSKQVNSNNLFFFRHSAFCMIGFNSRIKYKFVPPHLSTKENCFSNICSSSNIIFEVILITCQSISTTSGCNREIFYFSINRKKKKHKVKTRKSIKKEKTNKKN